MKEKLLNEELSLKIEFSGVQSMNDRASIKVQGGEQGGEQDSTEPLL